MVARIALLLAVVGGAASAVAEVEERLEEVIVRADASVAASQGAVGSVTSVGDDAIGLVRASHVHELLVRVPGVWISRGSGHEHLTAIRSGVLTGAGACGSFLLLQNGIPIRPAGFCNVNNLFEMNTEQAAAIEVVRGPASALFGGNALHGAVNVVTAAAASDWRASMEVGSHHYAQGRFNAGGDGWWLDGVSTAFGGYRDDTGYGQHKLHAGFSGAAAGWRTSTTATATLLNQETGAFVRGFEVYDSPRRYANPNPEAYRDAWSARLASVWRRRLGTRRLTVTPYLRRSSMAFLQHFLPGQPREQNAQTSGGIAIRVAQPASPANPEGAWRWTVGMMLEAFAARLSERQDGPTEGSAFLIETRPSGTHYDFRVDGLTLAAFYDAGLNLGGSVEMVTSARLERNGYDYDNRHIDGNSRDDGSHCGFGGCLYTRPADRRDGYTNFAGRLGLQWFPGGLASGTNSRFYAVAGLGFRPPQITELYRLQRGQTLADLDSETLRSLELGLRAVGGGFEVDVALYGETTRKLIFRDANGFNVSDGRIRSTGIEVDLSLRPGGGHGLNLTASHARHRYAFTSDVSGGERIVSGNAVDTAPRWLGSAHWHWRNAAGVVSEFELVYLGSHYINASNTARYRGHSLLNWRGSWDVGRRVRLFVRLTNLLDAAYADRADFAFGNYRYFPGPPRQANVGVEVRLSE